MVYSCAQRPIDTSEVLRYALMTDLTEDRRWNGMTNPTNNLS